MLFLGLLDPSLILGNAVYKPTETICPGEEEEEEEEEEEDEESTPSLQRA